MELGAEYVLSCLLVGLESIQFILAADEGRKGASPFALYLLWQ
jgi:hypothetical protein